MSLISPPRAEPVIDWKSWLGMAVLVMVWGSSFLFIAFALQSFDPPFVSGARLALAAIATVPFSLAVVGPFPRELRFWKWVTLSGLFTLVIPFTLYTWGQQEVSSGMAALFITAAPIFTLIFAHVLGDERITGPRLAGFLIGFAGVSVLMLPGDGGGVSSFWHAAACALSGVSFAMGGMTVRFMPSYNAIQATSGAVLAGAVIYLPIGLMNLPVTAPSTGSVVAICILGLVQTGAAQVLRYLLIRRSGAVFMSSSSFLFPIWAIVLGWIFLGETLSPLQFLGLVLIIGGLAITRLVRRRRPPQQPTGV